MKTSVILISYNQENYIRQAIESILSQHFNGDIEVIIADDCSTDSTYDIIREYEPRSPFPFIYLPHDHNVGMKKNYQRAFAACTGDYIAILEGDDWWSTPDHIQQHIDFLEKHRRISMSFNRINVFHETENRYQLANYPFPKDYFLYSLKDIIIQGDVTVNLSSCLFRNTLIRKLPDTFFDLNFADWELSMFMAQYGKTAYLKNSTSVYRINAKGQWTSLNSDQRKQSIISTLNDMDDYFEHKYSKWFTIAKYNLDNDITVTPYMSWKTRIKQMLKKISIHLCNNNQ